MRFLTELNNINIDDEYMLNNYTIKIKKIKTNNVDISDVVFLNDMSCLTC